MMRSRFILSLLCPTMLGVGGAKASGDSVKIGVLNDQPGMSADVSGQGSVIAARMAVEDWRRRRREDA